MNLTPIELYLFLLVVIPLGVCFMKWRYSMKWISAAAVCAVLSWVYFNFWMGKLDPPDNGLANFVYLVSGWFWLLPIFGVFLIVFLLIERHLQANRRGGIGEWGFKICSVLTALIVTWNLFGRMSEPRAIREARQQLEKRGYKPEGREIPYYDDGHWIIRYPDTEFGEIRLTRNGKMSWIGGSG